MGYDMHAVLPLGAADQARYDRARDAFDKACEALAKLPREEHGDLDLVRVQAEDLSGADHRAYRGRTERYAAFNDALEAARENLIRTDLKYFRLNMSGISRYVHAMGLLGMLQTSGTNPYDFPASEGIGDGDWDIIYDLMDQRLKDLAQENSEAPGSAVVSKTVSDYVDAFLRVLLWVPEPVTGIYEDKFSSNDGWAVTPAEITAALATYRTKTAEDVTTALTTASINNSDGYWDAWINFLIHCENHGGFTVH